MNLIYLFSISLLTELTSILFETPPEILDNHALTMFEVLFGFLDSKQFEELMKYLNIELSLVLEHE